MFCGGSPTSRRSGAAAAGFGCAARYLGRFGGCRTDWQRRRTGRALTTRQVAEASAEIDSGVDIEAITELFLTALDGPRNSLDKTRQQMQRIGTVALATQTVPESVRRQVIAQRLPSHDWPERVLRLTAIDTATGELVVFDRDSGVGLVDAVAASCAVPGAWPPVTIDGRAVHGRWGGQLGQPRRCQRL